MEIKKESDYIVTLCHGCLSSERVVSRVSAEFSEIFFKLRDEDKYYRNNQDLQLCWECVQFLRKLKQFQARIKTAQCLLLQHLQTYYDKVTPNYECLSTLITAHINTYTKEYYSEEKHITEEPYILIEQKQEEYEFTEVLPTNKEVLPTEIKLENNDSIKEEFNCNNDSDDFDTEYKVNDVVEKSPVKKNTYSRAIQNQRKKKYEMYAIITRNDLVVEECMKLSERVDMSMEDYEAVLQRDKKEFDYIRRIFKCKECTAAFARKMDLLRHNTFCHNKQTFPYKCLACKTSLESASHQQRHWRSHSVMLKCALCAQMCRSEKELRKHINKKHTMTYACKNCGLELGTLCDFIKHYETEHEKVVCDYCNVSFKKKDVLASHIRRLHVSYYCNICDRSYSNRKSYTTHKNMTHPELKAGEIHKELSYCVECNRQYPSVQKYRQHLRDSVRHRPQKKQSIPCTECGKVFTKNSYMKNHYKLVHLKVTKHYCEQCDKYFTNGFSLRCHIDRVHKKIPLPRNKICDICGRGFSMTRTLINHRRTHTGERPHKCKYCPAAFAQETALKTHQKSQHKNLI